MSTNKNNFRGNVIDQQGNEGIASLKKQGDKKIKYSNHTEQTSQVGRYCARKDMGTGMGTQICKYTFGSGQEPVEYSMGRHQIHSLLLGDVSAM